MGRNAFLLFLNCGFRLQPTHLPSTTTPPTSVVVQIIHLLIKIDSTPLQPLLKELKNIQFLKCTFSSAFGFKVEFKGGEQISSPR